MSVSLSGATWESLHESGLNETIVLAAGIKDQTTDEITRQLLEARKVREGYLIPYHGVDGAYTGHYRIRVLLNGARVPGPKYLQPTRTGNHIYVPPGMEKGWKDDTSQILYVTEGEKKALAAAQAGLTCIGVGGVNSWRSRTLQVPRNVVQVEDAPEGGTKVVTVKLDDKMASMVTEQVAPELTEISWVNRQVVIVFDSDTNDNVNVQNSAFELALWLEDRGAEVGQFFLEPYEDGRKCGLDDYLRDEGADAVNALQTAELTYPLPANPRRWVGEELDSGRNGRVIQRRVARVALAYFDKYGQRYKDAAGGYFYFDTDTKILHPFRLDNLPQLRSTSFGGLVANELGIHTADQPTVSRLADMFATRDPVAEITPHRVVTTQDDVLYYQISDGRACRVNADSIDLIDNGTDDILFLPNEVEPIDEDDLLNELDRYQGGEPLWHQSLSTVNLEPLSGLTLDSTRKLLTCLFYLSPWLNRWRRLMPPLEVAVAEPNSGKTFLYNLRKGILTGRSDLEGLPDDFRGWVSSVSSAPALWVCDNLGGVRTDFWHRLNDELARLITDPTPTIELRQLYTTATVQNVPVQATFAVTTIKNPFTAPDILQRSLIYHLRAIPATQRDSNWYWNQMKRRSMWVAEHLLTIQRFFQLVDEKWDDKYLSGFRLVNFEQAILLIGEALGFDMKPVVKQLPGMVSATVAEYDPVVEALVAFVNEYEKAEASISQVIDWVQGDIDRRYSNIKTLDNSILLGRYINSHTYDIEQATGMVVERRHNQTVLKIRETA